MTWTVRKYGYEKYAILDERGTEIGFSRRRRDALLFAVSCDLHSWAARVLGDMSGHTEEEIIALQKEGEALVAQGIEAGTGETPTKIGDSIPKGRKPVTKDAPKGGAQRPSRAGM